MFRFPIPVYDSSALLLVYVIIQVVSYPRSF
jgi:hypothetical protein